MNKNRLEAFSDGVISVIITIMVLSLQVPHSIDWAAFQSIMPTFWTYVLSFVLLGIYWSNHHHMLHTVSHVNGKILWANLHLLFWLSLIPFITSWVGESHFAPIPVAIYSIDLFLAGAAYSILQKAIISDQGEKSKLAAAIAGSIKGKISLTLYAFAVPLAFVNPYISCGFIVAVALMWLVPDPRIEKRFKE